MTAQRQKKHRRFCSLRCGEYDPLKGLQKRIHLWREGDLSSEEERIVVISGWHGVGKTTLLREIEISEGGIYLNIENAQKRHDTSEGFVRAIQKQIEEHVPKKRGFRRPKNPGVLLLVDDVPWDDKHNYLAAFDEQILETYLTQRGGLLFAVIRHTHEWGFIRSHPEPMRLHGLTPQGVQEVIEVEGWKTPERYLGTFGDMDEHLPALARCVLRENSLMEGMRCFLRYWNDRQRALVPGDYPLSEKANQMLRLFVALNTLEEGIWDDWNRLKELIESVNLRLSPEEVRYTLFDLGWIAWEEEEEEEKKRFRLRWIPSIKRVLECWTQEMGKI